VLAIPSEDVELQL